MNRYDRRTGRRYPRKRRRRESSVWKVLASIALTAVVITCCILSIAALRQSKIAQTNAVPAALTSGQISNSGDNNGVLLTDVSDVVEQAMPSVVAITSRTIVTNNGYTDIWDYIMNQGRSANQNIQSQQEEVDSGTGSGTIVGMNDKELLILTSYHVVDGCSSLYVTFNDDSSVDGYIKSAASEEDIAVVAVPLNNIPDATRQVISVAKLCTEGVQVGDGIIVIGNALGYGQSVITGVISATDRELKGYGGGMQKLLQTDAAINAGNSGGCMLNAQGEIVGISEAKITETSVEGMCYAIPIYENLDLIEQLLSTGNVL